MGDLPAPDPTRILRIYAGSNELSPFHECYASEHTVLRLATGWFFAHHNADDPVAGCRALRKHAALYDVPERPVEISGPHAVVFLERILGLGRLRLRGPCGANGEFLLAATAPNPRKPAKIFPAPQQTQR